MIHSFPLKKGPFSENILVLGGCQTFDIQLVVTIVGNPVFDRGHRGGSKETQPPGVILMRSAGEMMANHPSIHLGEPENHLFYKENHLPKLHFGVPC